MSKDYQSYTMQDFLLDDGFRDWVQGQGSDEMFWNSFSEKYPDKMDTFRQAEHLIRAAGVRSDRIGEKEIRIEIQHFMDQVSLPAPRARHPPGGNRDMKPHRLLFRWGISMAAVCLLGFGLSWYWGRHEAVPKAAVTTRASPSNLVKTSNDTEKPLQIFLGDGSEVILSPKSNLKYPPQFSDSPRIVYLVGEASFSVKHQGQSFMVYTGDVVTKVLGTRFVVRAFDQDKKITVQVQTGKVSVYVSKHETLQNKKELNGLILTANQAAIFEKSISQLSKALVNNPVKLTRDTPEGITHYEEVPLPVIFRDLVNTYGIPIQFDPENFKACKITATLSNENLYEKLDMLCKTVSANYEIVDGQIVVSGTGCH